MRFRKLRIAWSVAWGLLAVLLCVLWVRSYWTDSRVLLNVGTGFGEISLTSQSGGVIYELADLPSAANAVRAVQVRGYLYVKGNPAIPIVDYPLVKLRIQQSDFMFIPYWTLLMGCVTLGSLAAFSFSAAPLPSLRLPRQFSLRTLLIVMTLVAVVLGVVVWAVE